MSHEMVMKAKEDSWDIVSEKYSEMYRVNRLKTFCDCLILLRASIRIESKCYLNE